jgi:hypothetical protein
LIEIGGCPLCPRKRTLLNRIVMSALCHKRTHAVKQKKVAAPTQQLAELSRDDDVGTGGVDANEASCH